MEPTRFDDFSRSLAIHANRRDALRGLGAGGIAAGLLSLFGLSASVQAEEPVTCILDFHAETETGPNENTIYDGTLTLVIESDGAIDDATLEMDKDEHRVVGHATGRALSLRIELTDELALSLYGVGKRDITRCRGAYAGTLGGPELDDLGTWQATRKSGSTTIAGLATKTATANSGSAPTPNSCPDGTEPCQNVCTPSCTEGKILNPATCQCEQGNHCEPGYTKCYGFCVDLMTDRQYCGSCDSVCLSLNCVDGICKQCTDIDKECSTNADCCSGWCAAADGGPKCKVCNGTVCENAPLGCTDTNTDMNNCGACGNACPALAECAGGSCQCPIGTSYCNGVCADVLGDPNNCGACGYVCPNVVTVGGYDLQQGCSNGACCGASVHPCATGDDCCSLTCLADNSGGASFCSGG